MSEEEEELMLEEEVLEKNAPNLKFLDILNRVKMVRWCGNESCSIRADSSIITVSNTYGLLFMLSNKGSIAVVRVEQLLHRIQSSKPVDGVVTIDQADTTIFVATLSTSIPTSDTSIKIDLQLSFDETLLSVAFDQQLLIYSLTDIISNKSTTIPLIKLNGKFGDSCIYTIEWKKCNDQELLVTTDKSELYIFKVQSNESSLIKSSVITATWNRVLTNEIFVGLENGNIELISPQYPNKPKRSLESPESLIQEGFQIYFIKCVYDSIFVQYHFFEDEDSGYEESQIYIYQTNLLPIPQAFYPVTMPRGELNTLHLNQINQWKMMSMLSNNGSGVELYQLEDENKWNRLALNDDSRAELGVDDYPIGMALLTCYNEKPFNVAGLKLKTPYTLPVPIFVVVDTNWTLNIFNLFNFESTTSIITSPKQIPSKSSISNTSSSSSSSTINNTNNNNIFNNNNNGLIFTPLNNNNNNNTNMSTTSSNLFNGSLTTTPLTFGTTTTTTTTSNMFGVTPTPTPTTSFFGQTTTSQPTPITSFNKPIPSPSPITTIVSPRSSSQPVTKKAIKSFDDAISFKPITNASNQLVVSPVLEQSRINLPKKRSDKLNELLEKYKSLKIYTSKNPLAEQINKNTMSLESSLSRIESAVKETQSIIAMVEKSGKSPFGYKEIANETNGLAEAIDELSKSVESVGKQTQLVKSNNFKSIAMATDLQVMADYAGRAEYQKLQYNRPLDPEILKARDKIMASYVSMSADIKRVEDHIEQYERTNSREMESLTPSAFLSLVYHTIDDHNNVVIKQREMLNKLGSKLSKKKLVGGRSSSHRSMSRETTEQLSNYFLERMTLDEINNRKSKEEEQKQDEDSLDSMADRMSRINIGDPTKTSHYQDLIQSLKNKPKTVIKPMYSVSDHYRKSEDIPEPDTFKLNLDISYNNAFESSKYSFNSAAMRTPIPFLEQFKQQEEEEVEQFYSDSDEDDGEREGDDNDYEGYSKENDKEEVEEKEFKQPNPIIKNNQSIITPQPINNNINIFTSNPTPKPTVTTPAVTKPSPKTSPLNTASSSIPTTSAFANPSNLNNNSSLFGKPPSSSTSLLPSQPLSSASSPVVTTSNLVGNPTPLTTNNKPPSTSSPIFSLSSTTTTTTTPASSLFGPKPEAPKILPTSSLSDTKPPINTTISTTIESRPEVKPEIKPIDIKPPVAVEIKPESKTNKIEEVKPDAFSLSSLSTAAGSVLGKPPTNDIPSLSLGDAKPSSTSTPSIGDLSFGAPPKPTTTTSPFGVPISTATTTAATTVQSNSPFGATTIATPAKPAGASSPPFGGVSSPFGTPSSTTTFGANPSTATSATPAFGTPTSSTASTIFGQQPTTTSSFTQPAFGSTPTPAFGQTSAPTVFGQQPAASGSVFGQSSSFGQTSTPSFGQASTPAFGQQPVASGSVFGQSSASTPSTSVFGQQPVTSGSVFGQSSAASSSSPFGQPATTSAFGQAAPSTSPFGATPTTTTSAFGQSQAAPSTSPFGQTTSPFGQPAATTSAFGQPQAAPSSPFGPPATSAFGQPQAAPSSPFGPPATSAFGQPQAAPSSSPFGATPSTTTSAFGQPSAAPSTSAFGGGGFGQPSAAPAFGSTSAFGAAPATTTSAFGVAPSTTTSAFGQPSATPSTTSAFGGGGFGQSSAAPAFGSTSVFGGGGFGQSSAAPAFGSTSVFGQPQQPSGSVFGQNKVFGSTSGPSSGVSFANIGGGFGR